MVKTINQSVTTEGFLSREITWDGKDDFGDKIGKGVYVYKLTVKSSITGEKSEKIEKNTENQIGRHLPLVEVTTVNHKKTT